MEKHGAEILYSTVKHVMHDVRTEDKVSQQDVLYEIIQIAKHWTKRKQSTLRHVIRELIIRILKERAYDIEFQLTEDEKVNLKTLMNRYISWVASGVWKVLDGN